MLWETDEKLKELLATDPLVHQFYMMYKNGMMSESQSVIQALYLQSKCRREILDVCVQRSLESSPIVLKEGKK